MNRIERISRILAAGADGLILLFALMVLTGGIAVKFDLATSGIVLGVVLLLDYALETVFARTPGR